MQHATHTPRLTGSTAAVPGEDRRFFVLVYAALVCLTFAAYVPALRSGFVFGEDAWLTRNPAVQSADGLRDIWLRPSASPWYSPLTLTSFWAEYRLWRLDPVGYHFDNVLLHAANAVLLYYLFWRLRVPGAWLAAAVFAVHPINAEPVAWIVGRQHVLSLLFYLLAALAYLGYAGVLGEAGPRRWWLCGIAIACLTCSLLAGPMAVTWPLAMLLIVWWRNGRLSLRGLIPLIPAAVIAVVAVWWIEKVRAEAAGPESAWSFADSLIIAGRAFWFYVAKLLCPLRLCFMYPEWNLDAARVAQYLFPLSAVAVIVVLWLLRRRIGRGPVTAVLLFAGALAPAMGLVRLHGMAHSFVADRWAYHAGPVLIVLITALLAEAARRLQWRRSVVGVAGCALVLVLAALTIRQAGRFRDVETFWRAVIRCNPRAWVAQDNLGQYLMARKRLSEAEQCLSEVVRLQPDNYVALTNLGLAFFGQNRPDQAIEQYRAALAVNPDYLLARNHLGVAMFQKGQIDEAIQQLRRAVDLNPNYGAAHQHLAIALEFKGSYEEAIAHYEAALAVAPSNTLVCNNFAWLLATAPEARLRNGPRAVDLARQACKATAWKEPNMLGTLAAALAESGDFEQALQVARTGYQIASAAKRNDALRQLGPMIRSLENKRPIRLGSRPASAPATTQAP